jgi:hypothetical protein
MFKFSFIIVAFTTTVSLSAMTDVPNSSQEETNIPAWAKGFKVYNCWLHRSTFNKPENEYTHCSETIGSSNTYYYYTKDLYKPNSRHIVGHGFAIHAEATNSSYLMKCIKKSCAVEKFVTSRGGLLANPKPEDTACAMLQRAAAFAKAHGYCAITHWKASMVDKACLKELKATCKENTCVLPITK